MFVVVIICLLAHAEVAKDISEDFFCVDSTTGDFGKVVETLAEVFGYEIAWEIMLKGIESTLDVEEGDIKGLLMADIGYEDFIIIGSWYVL
jgi:hypothetical protein